MTKYTATFATNNETIGIKSSKRIYAVAWAVFFTNWQGKPDRVCGWAGSPDLAQKSINSWLPKLKDVHAKEVVPAVAG